MSTRPSKNVSNHHMPHSVIAMHVKPRCVIWAAMVCSMIAVGFVSPANAACSDQDHEVSSKAYRLYTPVKRRIWIAGRTAAPITSIRTQPRFHTPQRDLVEVQLINTTIHIDPNADYIRQGEYRVDANSSIPAAQRLYRSLMAKPSRIIRRADADQPKRMVSRPVFRPHAIMMRPQELKRRTPNKNKTRRKRDIPTVPGPPKKKPHRLMAAVDTGGTNL